MTEHTPTPWFKNRRLEIGPRPRTNDQHDGMLHPVADVFGENGEADAAFIVKAVNHHEKMVEALKQSRDRLLWVQDVRDGKTSGLPQVSACIEHIDSILAAVGQAGDRS